MFGTLIYDLQRKEPTFVENPDTAVALSRNRHEKRHISCEYCRARKVRCSGQPSGCDRCRSVPTKCRYPEREERRRKQAATRLRPSSNANKGDSTMSPEMNDRDFVIVQGQHGERHQSTGGVGNQTPTTFTPTSTGTPSTTPMEPKHQRTDNWLSTYSTDEAGLGVGEKFGFDEWMVMDAMLDPVGLEEDSTNTDFSMMEAIGAAMPTDTDSINDLEDLDTITSPQARIPGTPTSLFDPFPLLLTDCPSDFFAHIHTLSNPPIGSQPPSRTNSRTNLNTNSTTTPTFYHHLPTPNFLDPLSATIATLSTTVTPTQSPPESSTPSPSPTQCTHTPTSLLKTLSSESSTPQSLPLDVLLSHFRTALLQISTLLSCPSCCPVAEATSADDGGETLLLLALTTTHLSRLSQRLVEAYLSLRFPHHQNHYQQQHTEHPTPQNGVPMPEERLQVLFCMLMVQFAEFSRLLRRLRGRCRGRRGHLDMAVEAEDKFRGSRERLRGSLCLGGGEGVEG